MVNGLRVTGVTVRFAETVAVNDVTLHVGPGEVLGLLGPSGCGKSSLLRAIAGLEPLAQGTVTWDGHDMSGVPVHRRGFGLLFQDGQLFTHRDVAGNVGYGVPRGMNRRARVAELLALVGLTGMERKSVDELSGGERQRVALARSLAAGPRVLLLDEPLSALDRELRERLAVDLREVLIATGTTAVFVTHDHDEVFTVADRVAVMSGGEVLQVDTPAGLWRSPRSVEVARFLGYEAFIAADDPISGPWVAAIGGPREHGTLAVAPGAVTVESRSTELRGKVRAVRLRRGQLEVTVDVAGVGLLTAHAVSEPQSDEVGLVVHRSGLTWIGYGTRTPGL